MKSLESNSAVKIIISLALLLPTTFTYAAGLTSTILQSSDLVISSKPTQAESTITVTLKKPGLLGVPVNVRFAKGLKVEYSLMGEALGSSVLDSKGKTEFTIDNSSFISDNGEGLHSIDIYFNESKRYRSSVTTATLAVFSPKDRVFVIDLDHTLVDASSLDIFRGQSVAKQQPLEDAPEYLNQLIRELNIQVVYVTNRHDLRFREMSQKWLSHWKIPTGPIFMRPKFTNSGKHKYKSGVIGNLIKSGVHITAGIGDKPDDAKAYLDHGLHCYIIPSEKLKKYPQEAIIFKSWKDIYLKAKEDIQTAILFSESEGK